MSTYTARVHWRKHSRTRGSVLVHGTGTTLQGGRYTVAVMQQPVGSLLYVSFVAGSRGMWKIDRISPVTGATLPAAPRIDVVESATPQSRVADSLWQLQGVTSNVRYTNHDEVTELKSKQEGLN